MVDSTYAAFLHRKSQEADGHGFEPAYLPDCLFDFQRALTDWSIRRGRAALMAGCGMGKTICSLVWAENVVRHTNRPVLIATPLAVGPQFVAESIKFGIEATRSRDGTYPAGARIVVTNYEQLHKFDPANFAGMVCDESAAIKSMASARRAIVTEFMRKLPYRLLGTATPAPNDYIELGTSSEALGELGYMDMLARYFVNDQNNCSNKKHHRTQGGEGREKMRFRGHAEGPFWRWVCSWARAVRKPSDLGFDDGPFILPPLEERAHVIQARTTRPGWLFEVPASGMAEEREERRRTIQERCEKVAELVATGKPALVWCHLNDEGNLLAKLIPDAVQVSGADSDDAKEENMGAFTTGEARVMVSKPKLGAWGMNWQHCAHVVTFPDHSFEAYHQGVRRCWRFGQTQPVVVDIVSTDGEKDVMSNLRRKADQADRMFAALVENMNRSVAVARTSINLDRKQEIPAWLSPTK